MIRSLFLTAVCISAIGLSAPANAFDKTGQHQPAAQTSRPEPSEAQLQEHEHYTNSDGKRVHSPAHVVGGGIPAGASAKCGDGSYSFSLHHRGTCSHHGGVAQWLSGG
ncbi:DUF3761 domain-containing protein [Asaia spathodeae]|uniref:DUF3761 domain-containing protein n=1 Tax=Asaia spathodeae TaxID=657016 RepID=A0ABX2P6I6_9PROT